MAEEKKEAFLHRWSRLKHEQKDLPVKEEAPAPDLPPVEKLTPESDYAGFMHPKVEDALRYAWSLPVASVLVGCDTGAVLKRTIKSATGFKAFHAGEMDALRQKARPTAGDGRYERYKTTQAFDMPAGKAAHGFE